MADCYPPDFTGPLPPGGYYCTPNVPSFFGQLNAVLQQGATTAAQIKSSLNQFQGKSVAPPTVPSVSTTSSTVSLLILALVVALVIWLVVREL
jgi:hypothetical protein